MIRAALAIVVVAAIADFPANASDAPSPLAGNRSLAAGFRVRSVSGESLDLARLRARGPVLLDFWATWCGPCVASLPELEALHRRFGPRGLTLVGVSVDGPRNFAKVRPFAARAGLTYPIVLDEDGGLQQSYRVLAVPTSILVAPDGSIARIQQGYRPGELAAMEKAIEALLPAAASGDTASAEPR